jgi:hypothetical protein
MFGKLELGTLDKVPSEPVRWPRNPEINTRIRQVTTAAQPSQPMNGLGSQNIPTINQPKPVSILRIGTSVVSSTTKNIIVSFLQNPADPNYQKVNVHLKLAHYLPVLVGSGPTSPLTIALPRTTAPATILVQAEGNWGPHPLQNSPSRTVNLA